MIFSLITNLEHLDVVLASASPRRYELLSTTGIKFKVVPSGYDEVLHIKDPIEYVKEVARQKGLFVARDYPGELVISADTIVVANDAVILGKPKDEGDAFRMLKMLSGKTHKVYTAFGLFLLKYDKSIVEIAETDVTFRKLSNEEIWEYIGTGEPFDKAGAYAIQGQGAMLVQKINGCCTNVIGFPLSSFFITLDTFLSNLALHEEPEEKN